MNCALEARRLADFVSRLPDLNLVSSPSTGFSYYHIGALFTDVVLQAGLNYETVVKPRVQKILIQYPDAYTVEGFKDVIHREGLQNVIQWKHQEKISRIENLIAFADSKTVNSCTDLKQVFLKKDIHSEFLAIKGFGPKTLDYLLKLLSIDCVAVDRHIYSFVKMAEIDIKGYEQTKKVVEHAADFLNITRATIDQLIWKYMSQKRFNVVNSNQFSIEFPE